MSLLAQINKKKEDRAKLVADARSTFEAAEKAGRALDGEDRARWERMIADADKIREEVENLEKLDAHERSILADPANTTKIEKPEAKQAESDEEKRAKAFRSYLRTGMVSPEVRALQSDSDVDGGYLVPPQEFIASLIKGVDNAVFMRQKATIYQISSSDQIGAPSLDTDMSAPTWTTEVETSVSTDSSMALGKRNMQPNKLSKLAKVSRKLLRVAAIGPEALVRDRMAYQFAVTLENAYLNGSGANQPLGVFTASASGISTGRDVSTGNSTTAVALDGLKEAKWTLKIEYWGSSSWIFHPDAGKQIDKLKDGDGNYIWQPSVQVGQPDRLLGLPIVYSQYAPNTFTTGLYVGILGDFSKYWIVDLGSMEVQRLNELYAEADQVGFIGRMWSDGQPVLEEAFVRVKLA